MGLGQPLALDPPDIPDIPVKQIMDKAIKPCMAKECVMSLITESGSVQKFTGKSKTVIGRHNYIYILQTSTGSTMYCIQCHRAL